MYCLRLLIDINQISKFCYKHFYFSAELLRSIINRVVLAEAALRARLLLPGIPGSVVEGSELFSHLEL